MSGVRAHQGGVAAEASRTIGAKAYARGDAIAFAGAPDLHTAAHEAAHVMQQRRGVSLSGGVGRVGDAYERHADLVADAVVRGESAEGLLSAAPGGTSREGVQRAASPGAATAEGDEHQRVECDTMIKVDGKQAALEGERHTCDIGAERYNQQLSVRRAEAVRT